MRTNRPLFMFPRLHVSRSPSVVAPQHADDDPLHPAAVGVDDPGFHILVGGLEADLVAAFLVEPLERRLAAIQKGHSLLAVAGVFTPLDDDEVAVAEMI